MPQRPNPNGWQGGSEDFGFLRTLDGHITSNVMSDPDDAERIDENRNVRQGFADADLGGDSYRTCWPEGAD